MSTELFERCHKEGRVKVVPPPPGKVWASREILDAMYRGEVDYVESYTIADIRYYGCYAFNLTAEERFVFVRQYRDQAITLLNKL